jgi:flagellar motor component MotA
MSSIPTSAVENTSSATPQRPIHTLVGGGLLLFVIGWAAFGSGDITMFIDINSMILVMGITAAGLWMCYGPMTLITTFRQTLLTKHASTQTQLKQAVTILSSAYQLVWAAGLSGTLLGLVIMLSNMDDPAAIGPGMAVALLTTMYGLIFGEFVIGPIRYVMNSQITHTSSADPAANSAPRSMLPYGIAIVMMVAVVFFVLIVSLLP